MPVVDNAIYIDGKRAIVPESLDHTFEKLRACPPNGRAFAWIGLLRPTPEEIKAVADEFDLHPLAIEDTVTAHQRPKLERYGDVLFVVLRPARYVDPAPGGRQPRRSPAMCWPPGNRCPSWALKST